MTLNRVLPLLVVLLAAGTSAAQGIRNQGRRSTAVKRRSRNSHPHPQRRPPFHSELDPRRRRHRRHRPRSDCHAFNRRGRAGQGRAARPGIPPELQVLDVSGARHARRPGCGGARDRRRGPGRAAAPGHPPLCHGNRHRARPAALGAERSDHRGRRAARRLRAAEAGQYVPPDTMPASRASSTPRFDG